MAIMLQNRLQILGVFAVVARTGVVPLTGHVDRNHLAQVYLQQGEDVVPLTGHVDRNFDLLSYRRGYSCRAPHGARG